MCCKGKAVKEQFEIACASHSLRVYCELWKPELGQTLQVRRKIGNL